MPLPRPRTLLRTAATLALLVLVLGLPRLLVLCEHECGHVSLTFAHGPGACCHEPAPAAADDGHAGPRTRPDDGCDHTELAVDLAPAPRPATKAVPDTAPTCCLPPAATPSLPALRAPPRRPDPTGPPRTDRRSALRATTLLLV